jgi:hypothetical protein
MSSLIRYVVIGAALICAMGSVSAAPRPVHSPYTYSSPSDFNPATYFDDLQHKFG